VTPAADELTPAADGYRLLLLAALYRAVLDARAGDTDAREWLLSAEARDLADALDVPYWPPPLDKRAMMSGKSKRAA
jgi:hypothetical protein